MTNQSTEIAMVLLVDAVRDEVHCPNLMLCVDDYEGAFEALNELVRNSFQLLKALVRSEDGQLRIPIEAFDGQPVEVHLRALQAQWRQLLADPPAVTAKPYSLKEWLSQLDAYYEAFLTHLEKMIFLLQIRRRKLQFLQSAEQRERFGPRVDKLLEINQRLHRQTLESCRRNQERIRQLTGDP